MALYRTAALRHPVRFGSLYVPPFNEAGFTQKLAAPSETEIATALRKFDLCLLDADKMAAEAGSPLSQNVVMLGAAARSMPLKPESLLEAVRRLVPKKTIGINTKAFEMGREFGGKC